MPRLKFLCLALGLCCGSLPAFGAEIFVSQSGNNSTGNGTPQNPYRTIQYALNQTQVGDIVTVREGPGPYQECDVRLRRKVTLQSPSGELAHIHCDMNVPDSVVVQVDPQASGSVVRNLELSGSRYYGVMLQTWWYQGNTDPSQHGASDVLLEDLHIHHTGRDGIKITPKSDNATIRRVHIHHTGAIYPEGTPIDDKNADGIDNVNGSFMTVQDSYIHDIATTGLYFKGGAQNVIIERNRIENTGVAGILAGFDTSVEFFDLELNPDYYEAIGGIVRNNFVKGTNYSGIGAFAAKDTLIANNTILDAAQIGHAGLYYGIVFQDWDPNAGRPANSNVRMINNIVAGSTTRCIDVRYSNELGGLSGLSGPHQSNYNGFTTACRFSDRRPQSQINNVTLSQWQSQANTDRQSLLGTFVVDNTGHIPATSPAVGRGTVLAEVFDDIDQQPRLTSYDIGADQTSNRRGRFKVVPPPTPRDPNTPPRTRPRMSEDLPIPTPTPGEPRNPRIRPVL